MRKQLSLLFIFSIITISIAAQVKKFPAELHIGQLIDKIMGHVTREDTIVNPRTKEIIRVYIYDTTHFSSLIAEHDILKVSLGVDPSDTIRMIQVLFKISDKNYFESFRKYLPDQGGNLERYGTKNDNESEQVFENIVRYKTFFISTALNASWNVFSDYNSINTASLTVGFSHYISIRKL
ncbi:MAG: hypothetical protein V4539_08385 [Bacteroidota bacterium]